MFEDEEGEMTKKLTESLRRAMVPPTGLRYFSLCRLLMLLLTTEFDFRVRALDPAALVALGLFSYGCSLEEHVRGGMCFDGRCGQRASWEKVRGNINILTWQVIF